MSDKPEVKLQPQPQPQGPSKRTVSLAIAIILLIVGIGELLDLSKDLSSQGKRAQASSNIAISDINSFLSSTGCSLRFNNAVTDYALDNQQALTALTNFAASGVKTVVRTLN